MIGTALNVAGILAGGLAGATVAKHLHPRTQQRIRTGLAGVVVYTAGVIVWSAVHGPIGAAGKQFVIAALALVAGNLLGRRLGLQRALDRLGREAGGRFAKASAAAPGTEAVSVGAGFMTCTLLFCANPVALLGAVQDGIGGEWRTLALKAAVDGLAAMGLAATFRWAPLLAAVPVLALQGTLTLVARAVAERVGQPALVDSVNLTGGLIVACVALVVLDLRKVPLADYLPALVVAPLLTRWR